MCYWFYVRNSDVTSTDDDGKKSTRYPLASILSDMKPSTRVTPSSKIEPLRAACNAGFALAYQYSRGHDLMEEIVASKCGPLGKNRPAMTLENVQLPVFGKEGGVPFPCFNIQRSVDETEEEFVRYVE